MPQATQRVLAVLELLQNHGRMTGAELARRLEVDPRTVRRYIASLEELGIPVTAERGRDGSYSLVSGFKLPPMMFTQGEALALSVGLVAARGLGLAGSAPAATSAQAKLERVMPAPLRKRARAVERTVRIDLRQPTGLRHNDALIALSSAAQSHSRGRLRHRSGDELTEREFDPYGLAYRGGRWYAVGFCHLRQSLRSFRLDRVESVEPLELHFEPPAEFDVMEHLTLSLATLPRAHSVEVLLATDLATARREVFAAFGVLEPAKRGVLLRGQTDDPRWFALELSRLPFGFTILRPTALKQALRAHARDLARRAQA